MGARPEQKLVVGRITGAHGLKGWLKLHSYTDPAENILQYKGLVLERGRDCRELKIDGSRHQGKGMIVHVVGVDDRNAAEAFGRGDIVMSTESLPELAGEEYYWHQLEGLTVVLAEDETQVLGVVDHLIATGANDVLAVVPSKGSQDDKRRLIPYLPGQVVKRIDIESQRIEVDWDPDF